MTILKTRLLAALIVSSSLLSYAYKGSATEFKKKESASFISEAVQNNETPKWEEKNGYVIMEAENTTSDLGLWITKTDVPGFTGENHLEFTGNQNSGGQPKSPLQYTFKINTTGNYRIMLRGRRRITDGRGDHSNDCWIRIDGDFGVATKDVSSGELNNPNKSRMANLSDLQTNAKFVAGAKDEWKWGPNMFRHDDFTRPDGSTFHKERPVVPGYRLKAGETYTLTISGRSKQFNLDRIIIGDYEKLTWTQFTTAETLEETLIEDTTPTPPVPTPPAADNSDVPYKGGNIIYFSDGNGGDIDDVGANALSLYTLSRAGLTDKVKLYVWADVFWYNGANAHKAVNQKTINRAISNWGYSSDIFVAGDNYNSERNKIVNSIKTQINAATADEPLYLVFAGAGGFTYTYEAFDEIADKSKLKNVVLVSHSLFNEVFVDAVIDQDGDGVRNGFPAYSWPDLEAAFSQPIYWSHQVVLDQNGAGNTAIDGFASNGIGRTNGVESPDRWIPWNWMGSFNNQTKFILDRMQETVVLSSTRTEHGKADASDFGMIWYMLTGNKKGNPYEVQDYFQSGKLPKPFYITNVDNGRRISANIPLLASDFQTERTTNGRLKTNTTRATTTVSGTTNNLGAKWFKVPAPNGQNTDDYLLVNALTGLSLRSLNNNNGAGLEVKNDYKVSSNSVWFEQTSQLLTNRNSQKQIRKNEGNNNLSQVTLSTNVAKWTFTEVSGPGTGTPSNPDCSVINAHDFSVINVNGFDPATKATIPPVPADGVNHGEKVIAAAQENGLTRPVAAETTYTGTAKSVVFSIKAVGEPDGECTYAVYVNGTKVGEQKTARTFNTNIPAYTYQDLVINTNPVAIKSGDVIRVTSNQVSNGLVPEGGSFATARGRWRSLEICEEEATAIDVVSLESPVLEFDLSADYNIDVTYEASQARDIYVAFYNKDNNFIGNGFATVQAGKGVVTINANNFSTAPVEGTGNIYRAFIRPVGTNFSQNIGTGVTVTDVTFKEETVDIVSFATPVVTTFNLSGDYPVAVNYEASEARDVVIAVYNPEDNFIGNGKATVSEGTGEVVVNVNNFTELPTEGAGYTFRVFIRPLGATFQENIGDEVILSGITFEIEQPDLTPEGDPFYIVNRKTGLKIRPQTDEENSAIIQVPYEWTGDYVRWERIPTTDGYFYLRNVATGDFFRPELDEENSPMVQKPTTFLFDFTQWKTVETQEGYFYLVNRATEDYIRPLDDNRDAAIMQVNTSFGWHYTQWTFETVGSSSAKEIGGDVVEEVSVYPNPTTGELFVNGTATSITIHDVVGNVVYTQASTETIEQIDITDLDSGVYFMTISNGSEIIETTKILKK